MSIFRCNASLFHNKWLLNMCSAIALVAAGSSQISHAKEITDLSASIETSIGTLKTIRVFEEPLIPTKVVDEKESAALLAALVAYQHQSEPDDFHLITSHLSAYPQSAWRVSLLTNLGLSYYHYGYFSKAIDAWEQAWQEGRDVTDQQAKVLVDRAVGELVRMHARLGHKKDLVRLLKEIGERPVSGPATEAVAGAREGLWSMENDPGVAYLCGPKALKNLLLSSKYSPGDTQFLDDYRSGPNGVTLAQVAELAKKAKLTYKLAYRESDQEIPIPSLVHWRVNHFATVVAKENDRYHLKDPTFGTDLWITKDALDSESSGYFLLPQEKLGTGFREVSLAEATQISGRGLTSNNAPGATSPGDDKGKPPCENAGMCGYNFHSMVLSLNLTDRPVGYKPAKGPSVFIELTYNQREANQPANFTFFNVGPKWTLNWLSYIQDDPNSAGANVMRYVAGGGSLNYAGYNSSTGAFTPEAKSTAVLVKGEFFGIQYYSRTLSDGSVETYGRSDGATTYPRRFFLTAKSDAAGNVIYLGYDSQLRLTSITDGAGKITTFTYGVTGKPLLVSTITDPFGRSAQLSYDSAGRLQQITDAIGLTSQFTYDASSLINSMTTPYGTTQFSYGSNGTTRWLEITDPLGYTERAEYRHSAPGIATTESKLPTGIGYTNNYMQYRNTFFWDKSLYPVTHTDYTKAQMKHWLHDTATGYTAPVLESLKNPLENRIWYNYPNQTSSYIYTGTSEKPTKIARVMANNATQLTQIAYNSQGNKTSVTDPIGRQTLYDYASNGIDVTTVRQKTGASTYTTIAQFTYNTQHQPLTYTDGNGKTTTYTYNGAGQRLTATDPLGHVTTYQYDSLGNLTAIIDANSVTVASFTYDSAGRVATRKDAANNTLTYEYDNFDRLTKVTYPDSTYEQYTYNKLDIVSKRDRMGLITQYSYDANRQLISMTDPANRVTQYEYYPNGTLKKTTDALNGTVQRAYDIQARLTTITDPKGVQTVYAYDVSGNRISETSPDSGLTQFTFDAASSVIQKTDARNVVSSYGYDVYKRLTSITYPASTTENVSFAYDSTANSNNGMGRLTSSTTNDGTTSFTYDAAGNVTNKQEVLSTGTFTTQYAYDNNNRNSQITYPSGRIVNYTRNTLGQITQVQSKDNASATVKTIVSGVTYLPFGPINNLNFGNGATTALQYDADYRLTNTNTTSTPAWAFQYAYDSAGNILSKTDQSTGQWSTTHTYDALNRLVTDNPFSMSFGYQYDVNNNRTQLTLSGIPQPATYASGSNRLATINSAPVTVDAAGNVTAANGLTYTYNNANRLASINNGSFTTNYRYSANGVRTTKTGSQTLHYDYDLSLKYLSQSQLNPGDNRYLKNIEYIWLGDRPVAQVTSNYAVVSGVNTVQSSTLTYIHADHLNTPRALTDSTKKLVFIWPWDSYNLLSALSDPDGDGVNTAMYLGFPGQTYDEESGLFYNINRYYDPFTARYTQPDLIGLSGGVNRYAYTRGNPLRLFDFLGLEYSCVGATASQAAACDYLENKERALERADEARALCQWDAYYKALADAARWDWMYLHALGQQPSGTAPESGTEGGNGDPSEPERPQPPGPQMTNFNSGLGVPFGF